MPPTNQPDPAPDARTQRHLRMLAELAEIGMDLARAVHRQAADTFEPPAKQSPNPIPRPTPAELGLIFARVSRAVRQTIALEAKLAAPPTQNPARRPTPTDPRRAQLARLVHAAVAADPNARARRGTPHQVAPQHVNERLDADDVHEALDDRLPMAHIVATICNDLGIAFDIAAQPDELLVPPPGRGHLSRAPRPRWIARPPRPPAPAPGAPQPPHPPPHPHPS